MYFLSTRRPGAIACRWSAISVIFIASFAARAIAGDWPQILGPTRNGAAADEKIVDSLPAGSPKIVWEHEVGEGYAGVAVAAGTAVVFHRVVDQEIVEGLDARSGKRLWKQAFPATYAGGINSDKGPRCVPLIHKGHVYLFGAAGDLHCVALKEGAKRWSRSLENEYSIPQSFFGVGSTPIAEGDKLLVNVGGKGGAGIVAFSLADGKPVWKATNEQASYSSPTAATIDGERQVIFVTRLNAVSIDPENGKVRWEFPFGARGPTVNAATPLVLDDSLFLSASYGIGAVCRKIGRTSTEEVWANDTTMSSQFSTSVPLGKYLYGVDGRQDSPPARLRCIDPKTGKVLWTKAEFPVANLIVGDGKLVIVTDNGYLILAAASPEKYNELGRAKLAGNETRALPALANGLLYVRDKSVLKCVDLRAAK
jgi:outer membrane protein assembly factor BamB